MGGRRHGLERRDAARLRPLTFDSEAVISGGTRLSPRRARSNILRPARLIGSFVQQIVQQEMGNAVH